MNEDTDVPPKGYQRTFSRPAQPAHPAQQQCQIFDSRRKVTFTHFFVYEVFQINMTPVLLLHRIYDEAGLVEYFFKIDCKIRFFLKIKICLFTFIIS